MSCVTVSTIKLFEKATLILFETIYSACITYIYVAMEFPEAIKFLMKFITLHGTIFPPPGVIEVVGEISPQVGLNMHVWFMC